MVGDARGWLKAGVSDRRCSRNSRSTKGSSTIEMTEVNVDAGNKGGRSHNCIFLLIIEPLMNWWFQEELHQILNQDLEMIQKNELEK